MSSDGLPFVYARFILRVVPERVLIPKCALIACFGIILYLMIFVNYFLRRLAVPLVTYIILGAAILLFLSLEAIWTYMKYHDFKYEFYQDHILVRGIHTYRIDYIEINGLTHKKTFFDRFTKTATILLNNPQHRYMLKYVPESPQVYSYVEQMISKGKRDGFSQPSYA